MKYKIVEINSDDHSIVVRFYTDRVTEEALAVQVDEKGKIQRCRTDLSIDLPVPAPTGQELEKIILRYAPRDWLAKIADVADPMVDTSLAKLLPLLGVEQTGSVATEPSTIEMPLEMVVGKVRT